MVNSAIGASRRSEDLVGWCFSTSEALTQQSSRSKAIKIQVFANKKGNSGLVTQKMEQSGGLFAV